jgi:hypothetical protein
MYPLHRRGELKQRERSEKTFKPRNLHFSVKNLESGLEYYNEDEKEAFEGDKGTC